MTALSSDPEVEELLRDGWQRTERPLAQRRERLVEHGCAAVLVAVSCALLAAEPSGAASLWVALLLTALFAGAGLVRFSVGAWWTSPTQLVFIPMLLLLPPGAVPLLVAAAYALTAAGEAALGRLHRDRIVLSVGNAWFAVGPAAVLVAFGAPEPSLDLWPLFAVALAAQFASDAVAGIAREWLAVGTSPAIQLRLFALVFAVDAALAPVGFLAGTAAATAPAALLLVVPLGALLAVFGHERERRIEHALALSEAYRGSSVLMAEMLEAGDAYTGGEHTRGVVALALDVGRELDLDARAMRTLEFGALLHDVGKVKVPAEILNKPGKLTPAEWEIVKRHPVDGQRMLERIGGVLAEVGLAVRHHHERWDGRGYPDGLAGDDIPLAARIITACDSYSAMTTNRSYRAAMPQDEAIAELRGCAGTQFDPQVVEAFVAVLERSEPAPAPVALAA
jgi:HD-GYP domain-containing protein (c-di-GMP phosphodiesterase class II)